MPPVFLKLADPESSGLVLSASFKHADKNIMKKRNVGLLGCNFMDSPAKVCGEFKDKSPKNAQKSRATHNVVDA